MAERSATWRRGLEQTWSSRGLRIALAGMETLARHHDVQLLHPLFGSLFVSVLAKQGGLSGYENRTEAMRALFGDILPDDVNSRQTKAVFGQPYWTQHSQSFGRSWRGEGIDEELVDLSALQRLWSTSSPPPAPTLILLKLAWLHRHEQTQAVESASTSQLPTRSS